MNLLDMIKPAEIVETKPKKENTKKTAKDTKKETKQTGGKYSYPFEIYLAAEKRDVSHIFQAGTSYSEDEITKAMLSHGFFEFSGSVKYDFIKKENTLVPIFQQPKKG